jgi:LemA protein
VQDYNTTVRQFPVNLTAKVFGYDVKPSLQVEDEAAIRRPPEVSFDDLEPKEPETPEEPAPQPQ